MASGFGFFESNDDSITNNVDPNTATYNLLTAPSSFSDYMGSQFLGGNTGGVGGWLDRELTLDNLNNDRVVIQQGVGRGPPRTRPKTEEEMQAQAGKLLSEKDYEDSPYYRPGLKFPNGVREKVADVQAQWYDQREKNSLIINNYQGNAATTALGFAANMAGTLTNPVDAALTVATGGFGGVGESLALRGGELVLNRLTAAGLERAAPFFAARVTGAIEGGLSNAAFSVASEPLIARDDYNTQQDYHLMDMVNRTVGASLMGAGIGGVVGRSNAVAEINSRMAKRLADSLDTETHKAIVDTVTNQIANGENVDVRALLASDQKLALAGADLARLKPEMVDTVLKLHDDGKTIRADDLERALTPDELQRLAGELKEKGYELPVDSTSKLREGLSNDGQKVLQQIQLYNDAKQAGVENTVALNMAKKAYDQIPDVRAELDDSKLALADQSKRGLDTTDLGKKIDQLEISAKDKELLKPLIDQITDNSKRSFDHSIDTDAHRPTKEDAAGRDGAIADFLNRTKEDRQAGLNQASLTAIQQTMSDLQDAKLEYADAARKGLPTEAIEQKIDALQKDADTTRSKILQDGLRDYLVSREEARVAAITPSPEVAAVKLPDTPEKITSKLEADVKEMQEALEKNWTVGKKDAERERAILENEEKEDKKVAHINEIQELVAWCARSNA